MTPQIIESDGDIFASGCEALVNPVDTTGAQGKGLALEFKRMCPAQCLWYRQSARHGDYKAGHVYFDCVTVERLERSRRAHMLVLFATTKAHWRKPSSLDIVSSCCDALVDVVAELGIRSVGIPALGCGFGGLDYADVRPLIMAAAERMTCERVVVFGPRS